MLSPPKNIQTGLRRLCAELEQACAGRLCTHVVADKGRPMPNGPRLSFAKLCVDAGLS